MESHYKITISHRIGSENASETVKVLLDGARATGLTLRIPNAFYAGGACYTMPLRGSSPADDHCEASATWSGVFDQPSCAELAAGVGKCPWLSQSRNRRAREAAQLGLLSAQPAPAHVP